MKNSFLSIFSVTLVENFVDSLYLLQTVNNLWSVAITVAMYNKILLGYLACKVVKRPKNQRFEGHLCPRLQGTDVSAELVRVTFAYVPAGAAC
jgi:hypothetical protein